MQKKINIGVLFGGKSGEHDVSLSSSYNVIKAINKDKYDITMIGITLEGEWLLYEGDVERIKDGSWEQDIKHLKSDFSVFHDEIFDKIDIFFPVLHGTFGEDGTIQGFFEILGKPYVGCGVMASSVAMDKVVAKILFRNEGIPVVDDIVLYSSELKNIAHCIQNILSEFSFPVFVKPANLGSSVGISKAHDSEELKTALNEAAKFDNKIIIERFIKGKEIELAVLGNETAQASCAGYIIPCNEFYDYEAKYLSGDDSEIIIPAPLPSEISDQLKFYAIKAFKAISGSGLSRVDFFVEEGSNNIYINEINTMPGFTNISMYSKLWNACGISYPDLIEKLIALGFERYDNRKNLLFKKDF